MKIVVTIRGGCFENAFTDNEPGPVKLYVWDWDNFEEAPAGEPDCQHQPGEDCMNCVECGSCREDVDENDICGTCRSEAQKILYEEDMFPMDEMCSLLKEALAKGQ